jgi:hypothetical protein
MMRESLWFLLAGTYIGLGSLNLSPNVARTADLRGSQPPPREHCNWCQQVTFKQFCSDCLPLGSGSVNCDSAGALYTCQSAQYESCNRDWFTQVDCGGTQQNWYFNTTCTGEPDGTNPCVRLKTTNIAVEPGFGSCPYCLPDPSWNDPYGTGS